MNGLFMKYFVLEPNKNDAYGEASRNAMTEYAASIAKENPNLADDLLKWIHEINTILDEFETSENAPEAAGQVKNVLTLNGIQTIEFLPEADMTTLTVDELINEYIKPALHQLKHLNSKKKDPANCPKCGSKNIIFLQHQTGSNPEWECHDCGDSFYNE